MAITEAQFDRSRLWPASDFTPDFRPGYKERALAGVPEPLDRGALRTDERGVLQILQLQGGDPPFTWVDFEPDGNNDHLAIANLYARFGRGVSGGDAVGDEGASENVYWPVVHPGEPLDEMKKADLQHNKAEFAALRAAYFVAVGQPGEDDAATLRSKLADCMKAREGLEKQVFVREETLKAEREVLVKLRSGLEGVLDDIASHGMEAVAATKEGKGGIPAQKLRALGKGLQAMAADARKRLL